MMDIIKRFSGFHDWLPVLFYIYVYEELRLTCPRWIDVGLFFGGTCWIRWECQPLAINKYWPPSYTRNLQHYRMLLFFKMVPVYHYEICQLLRSLEPTTFSIHHQQKVEAKGPVGPGPWSLKSEAEIISTPPKPLSNDASQERQHR